MRSFGYKYYLIGANARGYMLPHSKIVYALAKAKVYVTDGTVLRMDDMITPNFVPDVDWKLIDLITYINKYGRE